MALEKKPEGSRGTPSAAEPEVELARDTLASLLRTLAELSLPTSRYSKDEFAGHCERLALELLLPDGSEAPPSERLHGEIRRLVRQQREAEAREYASAREGAQGIVADLVTNLRSALAEQEGQDQQVISLLSDMEQSVATGNLATIREVSGRVTSRIRVLISAQRARDRRHVERLSEQLRGMRQLLDMTRSQMRRDKLTGLYNRGAFDEAYGQTVRFCRAAGMELTLLMLDIDHFKRVNDDHGHQVGDDVLRLVSRRLAVSFPRKHDLVARYGGEEFAAVCRDAGGSSARMLGERAREAVAEVRLKVGDAILSPTISVGYAVLRPDDDADTLLRRADEALYAAKRNGRNRVEPQSL